MILADLPRVLLRRWYVVFVGLGVTLLLCVLAAGAVPLRHTAHAELVLLPSTSATGPGGNPYVGLGGLSPAGDVLSKALTDDATNAQFRAAGLTGEYTVAPDRASSAPLVLLTVETETEESALASLDMLLEQAPLTLTQLQRALGINERSHITSTVVTRSTQASPLRTPQLRAIIVAGALGLAATLLSSAAIDAHLERRRRRRESGVLVGDALEIGPDDFSVRARTARSHARPAPSVSGRSA